MATAIVSSTVAINKKHKHPKPGLTTAPLRCACNEAHFAKRALWTNLCSIKMVHFETGGDTRPIAELGRVISYPVCGKEMPRQQTEINSFCRLNVSPTIHQALSFSGLFAIHSGPQIGFQVHNIRITMIAQDERLPK